MKILFFMVGVKAIKFFGPSFYFLFMIAIIGLSISSHFIFIDLSPSKNTFLIFVVMRLTRCGRSAVGHPREDTICQEDCQGIFFK